MPPFLAILANDASGAHGARDACKAEFLRLASEVGEGFGEQVAERLAHWFREGVPSASQAEAVAAFEHDIKRLIAPAEYYLAINKPRGRVNAPVRAALIDRARAVRIEDEIARRGIKLRGRVDRAGPCPICGGHDRFAINIRKQCFICRSAASGDVIAMTMHLDGSNFAAAVETLAGERWPDRVDLSFRYDTSPVPTKKTEDDHERQQHRKAAWLWSQRRPIAGTIAERYLREKRKYSGPLPPTLGFLPGSNDYPPAMIAAYGLVDEPEPGVLGEPRNIPAVHLTRLLRDGSDRERGDKAKISIGRPLGHPIVLAPPNDLLALAITEGIEDALSVHQALGIGAWAAGSATYMPKLAERVPGYIDVVHVELHPDGGRRFAKKLIRNLRRRKIKVFPREAA
jgi:hypothetical protein